MDRKNLLSIGEMSKYTGAGIKALRYYDRINILKPAYVDPESERRYYSFNQIYLVGLITFCVELDIPLKELSKFISGQEIMDFQGFLSYGKEVAELKMKSMEKGLRLINLLEQSINFHSENPLGQVYTRKLPKKTFAVMPYKQSFHNVTEFELTKLLFDIPYEEEDDDIDNFEILEYGFMLRHTPSGIRRFAFVEVPYGRAGKNCKAIPGGMYTCRHDEKRQIENVADILRDYLADGKSFTAIETEVSSGKMNINKLVYELRVIKC
jgi:DNA-binding transcriptional MerR regulator